MAAACLPRWVIILAVYQHDINFKLTKAHANADELSRLPLSKTTIPRLTESEIFKISQIEA